MRPTGSLKNSDRTVPGMREKDEAISTVIEYLNVTAVLVVMMIVLTILTNSVIIEGPAENLKYHAFVDIGNGVSARIVDLYVVSPGNGRIVTSFDLPEDVANDEYTVKMDPTAVGAAQRIIVTDGYIKSTISIAGIGATKAVTGNTTGSGINRIIYDSRGV
ncbi:MAG: hypothetical protein JW931_07370 [Methanomicrobiaceae archaeon]|nr:hypothetical protein [Methanomicrobiaceae archaeon]